MNTKKSIQVLNSLIAIHNDRIEAYKTATAETNDNELIALFRNFIATSFRSKEELAQEVIKLGGAVPEGTGVNGRLFNAGMELKAALNGNNQHTVLSSCTCGEDKALDTYNDVLTNDIDFLTIEQHKMIYKQYVMLKRDHDTIKDGRDLEVAQQ